MYTLISGIFYIGPGETFDGGKVKAYPPGSVTARRAKSGRCVTPVTICLGETATEAIVLTPNLSRKHFRSGYSALSLTLVCWNALAHLSLSAAVLDLICLLVSRSDEIVSKGELMAKT